MLSVSAAASAMEAAATSVKSAAALKSWGRRLARIAYDAAAAASSTHQRH